MSRKYNAHCMEWEKLGLIFTPTGDIDWMKSHATVPVPYHLRDDIFRIYFSVRNEFNHNQVGYIEIDIRKPSELLNISEKPVLALGDLGYFDCDGIYGTCIVKNGEDLYYYYAGWNAGLRGLFNSAIGVAISRDGGMTFEKYNEIPVLHRSVHNKWSAMAPFVLKDEENWKMWYASGIKMYTENGELKSFYDIKLALSSDGLNWNQTGIVSIPLGKDDTNIARPCVIKEDGIYKVWYPYVSRALRQYRIGYGVSRDGHVFERKDEVVGIDVSKQVDHFDSEAITYPYIFDHSGQRYMLYNGNGFGKTGFGLARMI